MRLCRMEHDVPVTKYAINNYSKHTVRYFLPRGSRLPLYQKAEYRSCAQFILYQPFSAVRKTARYIRRLGVLPAFLFPIFSIAQSEVASSTSQLKKLSIEQLMDLEVT